MLCFAGWESSHVLYIFAFKSQDQSIKVQW